MATGTGLGSATVPHCSSAREGHLSTEHDRITGWRGQTRSDTLARTEFHERSGMDTTQIPAFPVA